MSTAERGRGGAEMSDAEAGGAQPTAAAIEALVHAIEDKERGQEAGAPSTAAEPTAPDPAPVPMRPGIVVASDPTRSLRGSTPGLIDRQLWEGLVAGEAQRQRRYRRHAALVLAEIDGLDLLAERMGPGAMARIIPPCAELLASVARESDRIARLTSSRFGILLVESDEGGAARYAARAKVAADRWLAESPWKLEMSVGWAAIEPDAVFRAMRDAEAHLRSHQH